MLMRFSELFGKKASSKKVYKREGTAILDPNFKHCGMKQGKREIGYWPSRRNFQSHAP